MKSKHTFLVGLFFFLSGVGYLCAMRDHWDPKTKPPVSLIEAHEIALSSLKDRHIDYYCTSATLSITGSKGDWEFAFYSSDGKYVGVSVNSDKKAKVSDVGFSY